MNLSARLIAFTLTLFLSDLLLARDAPVTWESFINNTDVVITGKVMQVSLVKDKHFEEFDVYNTQLKVAVKTVTPSISTKLDLPVTLDIFVLGLANVQVGSEGLFFLRKSENRWELVDVDVGFWKMEWRSVYSQNAGTCHYKNFEKAQVYSFPTIYLQDIPENLWELKYFFSEGCVFVPEITNITIFSKSFMMPVDKVDNSLPQILTNEFLK